MKVKVILKSLLFSYAVTGAFLLFLAFLLFQFDLGEKPVSAGIVAVYILSCFSGGFMSGKILRKDKYLWGILVGAFYYLLLITVSFVVQGKWEMSLVHAVTTFFMCLGGGALGLMRKNYDQLMRTKRYRKLLFLYGNTKDRDKRKTKINRLN